MREKWISELHLRFDGTIIDFIGLHWNHFHEYRTRSATHTYTEQKKTVRYGSGYLKKSCQTKFQRNKTGNRMRKLNESLQIIFFQYC